MGKLNTIMRFCVTKLWHWSLMKGRLIQLFFEKPLNALKSVPLLVQSMKIVGVILLSVFMVILFLNRFQQFTVSFAKYRPKHEPVDSTAFMKEFKMLEKETGKLNAKLNAFTPKSYYLIINSTNNEFFLFKGSKLAREGKCSTGSYLLLENGKNQKWLFKTPKGEFRILGKKTDPVWKKPDWAFVEDGLTIPSPNHSSRYEYGVLGDYALMLGHGYMIHGTLYQRFLGLPVTHGCIRLNDEDLKIVYRSLDVGAKVFIY